MIAGEGLSRGDISAAADRLAGAGIAPDAPRWLEEGVAADLPFAGDPKAARGALESLDAAIDAVVQPEEGRQRRLLVADMDSTMIAVECIDELADYAGIKAEVAEITEAAMQGRLDFAGALERRVALLGGLEEAVIARCHDERVTITPGAHALVATMRAHGARTVLVSGGFAQFAERVARDIGFDAVHCNRLGLTDGRISGRIEGAIVDAEGKKRALLAEAAGGAGTALAVGDGANDIPMLEAAGLGIAYRAKPAVEAAADARIRHNDLTALLYAQGYRRGQWAA